MTLGQQLIDLVASNHNTLSLALLFLSACIEYLFPPFPGDMITVFGAFLVARHGWSGPAVFGAVTLGSSLGCMLDYAVGRWLGKTEERWTRGRLARFRPKLDLLVARFAAHGPLYLTINRFIPSLRGLFFLAAGMAKLAWWQVLIFGTISALLWNALLLTLGLTVGKSWQQLSHLMTEYAIVFWIVLGVIALGIGIRWWLKRRA
jgi:membrane protein DedA with SNARE-associated domain